MHPIIATHLSLAGASCELAHDFLATRQQLVGLATTPAADATESEQLRLASLSGYFSRTLAWLRSIKKLDEASDVQAATVASSRSRLEAAVDLVLVRHEPKEHSFDMMFAWERSAKLAQAEEVRDFFAGTMVPDEYRTWVEFLTNPEVPQVAQLVLEELSLWRPEDYAELLAKIQGLVGAEDTGSAFATCFSKTLNGDPPRFNGIVVPRATVECCDEVGSGTPPTQLAALRGQSPLCSAVVCPR